MEIKSYLLGGVTAIVGTVGSIVVYNEFINPGKMIPSVSEIQQGYVVPSKLELELQDLDGDGQNEFLMKYDGKSYLLRLDEQGKPLVQDYEVRPAEIIPQRD